MGVSPALCYYAGVYYNSYSKCTVAFLNLILSNKTNVICVDYLTTSVARLYRV
jgi:hypothetical protein